MTIKDLKIKKESDLHRLLYEYREKLRDLRFKVSTGEIKTVHEFKVVKKTIARVLTLLNMNKTASK